MARIKIDDLEPQELNDEHLRDVLGGVSRRYSPRNLNLTSYDAWVPNNLSLAAYDAWVPNSTRPSYSTYDAWMPTKK